MTDMEIIRRLNDYDMDRLISVLELNEDRLYHWLILEFPTAVREDLDRAIDYVRALREVIKVERSDYMGVMKPCCPFNPRSPKTELMPTPHNHIGMVRVDRRVLFIR